MPLATSLGASSQCCTGRASVDTGCIGSGGCTATTVGGRLCEGLGDADTLALLVVLAGGLELADILALEGEAGLGEGLALGEGVGVSAAAAAAASSSWSVVLKGSP